MATTSFSVVEGRVTGTPDQAKPVNKCILDAILLGKVNIAKGDEIVTGQC